MTLKTLDCVVCGESVPYGRLSCPACGALLASVSGAPRPVVRNAATRPAGTSSAPPTPNVLVADVAVQAHVRSRPKTSARRRAADAATAGDPPAEKEPIAEPAVAEPPAVAVPRPPIMPLIAVDAALPEPAHDARLDEPFPRIPAGRALDRAFAPLAARPFVEDAAAASPWVLDEGPEPVLTARPYQRHLATGPDAPAATASFPGAYRRSTTPGAAVAAFADFATVMPAREALRSAALSGQARVTSEARGAVGSMRGLVDGATLIEIAGWFVIVGASMSVLGFLLPWSFVVIGSGGYGGYFNAWGLASPTHVLIFGALLGVLALGIVRTPVPAWLRSGVLGLVAGGVLVGLAWPYLVGRLGADVGVTVTALGGVALVIGGSVASWATRHAEPGPPV
ncbi:MAG TPA: hypothetical protein VGO15_06720 [Candidatus Limnocylindrales bacterium]|nr:hypothetical protein [Candidatus Limnocylindrales bacterium]